MSFVLTAAEFEVLCEQTPPPKESSSGTDTFETLYGIDFYRLYPNPKWRFEILYISNLNTGATRDRQVLAL